MSQDGETGALSMKEV
jgi:hypothetical protein